MLGGNVFVFLKKSLSSPLEMRQNRATRSSNTDATGVDQYTRTRRVWINTAGRKTSSVHLGRPVCRKKTRYKIIHLFSLQKKEKKRRSEKNCGRTGTKHGRRRKKKAVPPTPAGPPLARAGATHECVRGRQRAISGPAPHARHLI